MCIAHFAILLGHGYLRSISTLLLKGCRKKQEIVGNIFRMFGLGS